MAKQYWRKKIGLLISEYAGTAYCISPIIDAIYNNTNLLSAVVANQDKIIYKNSFGRTQIRDEYKRYNNRLERIKEIALQTKEYVVSSYIKDCKEEFSPLYAYYQKNYHLHKEAIDARFIQLQKDIEQPKNLKEIGEALDYISEYINNDFEKKKKKAPTPKTKPTLEQLLRDKGYI